MRSFFREVAMAIGSGNIQPGAPAVGAGGAPGTPGKRPSVAAVLLAEHEAICPRCAEVKRRNLPLFWLCGAGYVLAIATLRARGRRAVSA